MACPEEEKEFGCRSLFVRLMLLLRRSAEFVAQTLLWGARQEVSQPCNLDHAWGQTRRTVSS